MWNKFWTKFLILSILFVGLFSEAASINYHGRIIRQSNNLPLAGSNIRFNFKIKVGSSCVVYEENHDAIDMTNSNGYFSLNIGTGDAVFGTFDNAMLTDGSTVTCQNSATTAMNFSTNKLITATISEYSSSTSSYSVAVATISNIALKNSPTSISSQTLQGKLPTDFIQSSGSVNQSALENLVTGASTVYLTSSDITTATAGKLDKSANLSDLNSVSTARTNLGLGSLATLNSVGNSQITDLAYSKLTSVPSTFAPSAHSHAISDVTGLQTALNNKISATQLSLDCSSSQTVQYVSISDSYQCQSISISNTQVSGLGSLATLSSVGDSNITALSGSKLTGGVLVGTVSGSSCSAAGLLRYNSGVVEFCDGAVWAGLASGGGSGTVTSVSGTAPIQVANGTTTPSISIPKATGSVDGYLSSSDFSLFSGKQNALGYTPLNAASNLSDLASASSARTNLGLGSLATLSSVGNSQITDLAYSKLTSVPSTFTPSSHTHTISDVTGLQTALDAKLTASKLSLNCTAAQTVQYISVSDSYQCQTIAIANTQVSGLGALATLSTVGDAQITAMAGTKLTGGVAIGTVSGSSCSSAGLTRYNSGVLEFCNGSTWSSLSSTNGTVPLMSGWTAYTVSITATTTNPTKGTITRDKGYWRRVGDTMEIMYSYEQSTGGSAGSGTYIFGIPSGYTIDTSKSIAGVSQQGVVGHFAANGGSQFTQIWGEVKIQTTTGFSLHGSNELSRYIVSSGSGDLGQASIKYSFFARVPIVGWEATTNTIAAYIAPVKAKYRTSATQSLASGETIVNFNTVETDSTGSLVTTGTSWHFTASVAGFYSVKSFVHLNLAQAFYLNLYKNGSYYERIGQQPSTSSSGCLGTTDIQLAAGEYIDVRVNITTATTLLGNSSLNWISIVRVGE